MGSEQELSIRDCMCSRLVGIILPMMLLCAVAAGCERAGGRGDISLTLSAERAYDPVQFRSASVVEGEHFSTFDHNVVRIRGRVGPGGGFEADFLEFFYATGGEERWGRPISEVFEEEPGVLAQYFEKGVLEYRPPYGVEPRSLSEYIEGGQGELMPINWNPGTYVGPWDRKVSNVSVDGMETGFLDVFERLGGLTSFGNPVSDARSDGHPMASLGTPGTADNAVRQYFEAAVLQIYPGSGQTPMILPVGRELRDELYPEWGWAGLAVFSRVAALEEGAQYPQPFLTHSEAVAHAVSAGDGVLVARVGHPYALAYHPQHHLLYRPGDGWYAFYFDGRVGVLAYSPDGRDFSTRQVVTDGLIGMGVSIYDRGEQLYLLYTDANGAIVYVQPVTVSGGEVQLLQRAEAMMSNTSFSAQIPNMAFDPEGRPWIVARSYGSTPTGAIVDIWVTNAIDQSMGEWTEPLRVSTDEEALRGGAGTSGSLAFVDDSVVIVFDIDREMAGYTGDYRMDEELVSESAGDFEGTHDYILISDGERAHLAYHRPAATGQVMSYRYWTLEDSWSERKDVGETGTHATAMTVDLEGNVWVFYGGHGHLPEARGAIRFRILRPGESEFGPERCAVMIPDLRQAGNPWLAAAAATEGRVGLMWMEKPGGEVWEVKFRTLDLKDESRDAKCAG